MNFFDTILVPLGEFVIWVIESTGQFGVFFLMAVESANIPVPSEVIMPFAGAVAARGELLFWGVVLAGALGNTVGSVVSYWVGYKGGRSFVLRWGKYFFVSSHELEKGEVWIRRYGVHVAFWSRLLPVVRTFISLPAGIVRAPFIPFTIFTFIGSFIWSALLAWVGYLLGERWHDIEPFFRRASLLILAVLVAIFILYVWYHVKEREKRP